MTKRHLLPIAAGTALLPNIAWALDGRIDVADGGDTAWVLSATLLALLALPGLALFYSGRVQRKNSISVMLQCAAIFALVSILWIIVGYTLAFGGAAGGWLGKGNAWMLIHLGNVRIHTFVPESLFALFQMVFAMLAPALLVGAWAERARFGWAVTFAGLWSLIVYAPVTHWIMGDGWLAKGVGTLDWAGGITVHLSAGISALVVAIMVGKRKNLPETLPQHSPVLTIVGAALLWIAALALCGGFALASNDDAAAAMIGAHVGIAVSALTWLALERFSTGKTTAIGFAMGVVAGIATISPAAGYISPGAAIAFGMAGAVLCFYIKAFVSKILKIDDALNVFAIHCVGGIVGAMMLAPFLSETLGGIGYSDRMNTIAQLVAQIIGVTVVFVWSMVGSVIIALMASLVFPMRVSEEAEHEGLDMACHGLHA